MTREEIINGLKFTVGMFLYDPSTGEKYTEPRNDMDKTTIDACRGAIKLLEQEPCEDAISRQALYEWLDGWKEKNKYFHPYAKNEIIPICEVIDIIQSMPPVTPKADNVLDKIRAEIERERTFQRAMDEYEIAPGLRKALEIIDKYKAESEGK